MLPKKSSPVDSGSLCEAGARQKELDVICLWIQYEQRKYMSPFRGSSKGVQGVSDYTPEKVHRWGHEEKLELLKEGENDS